MNRSLPPALSRILAVLILLAAVGFVYVAAVQPLLDDYATTRQSIEDMRAAIVRYERVGAELAARRATLATLNQRQATSEGFLQGTNDALIAAQIQNRLKTLIEGARGELKSTQILPAQDEGRYRRVTVRAQMALPLAAAQRVFYGLETASPLLFLDNIDMRARYSERQRDRNHEDATIDVQVDVFGFLRNPKPPLPRQPTTSGTPPRAAADLGGLFPRE